MKKITFLSLLFLLTALPSLIGQNRLSNAGVSRTSESFSIHETRQNLSGPEIVLTQSAGGVSNQGIGCNNGITSGDNFYARVYNLGNESFTNYVRLLGIEFNLAQLAENSQLELKVFEFPIFPANFDLRNLPTPLATKTISVTPALVGSTVRGTFDTPAIVSPNTIVVATIQEIGENNPLLFIGASQTETQVSYIASEACGIYIPIPPNSIDENSKFVIDLVVDEATVGACSGTPNSGIATVYPTVGNTGSQYVVSSSSDVTMENGVVYQWQSSTDGGEWIDEGPASNYYSAHTATAPSTTNSIVQWRLKTTCTNSGEITFSDIATFTTMFTYCASMADDVNYEYITNVTFADISNTTTEQSGYNDFTSQVANVAIGSTNQISVTINSDGQDYIYAFIDWNQNGELNDAGEVYTLATDTYLDGPHTLNVTVPEGAPLGETRMRVKVQYQGTIPTPCDTFGYGEVEDYTVNVTPPKYIYDGESWLPSNPNGITTEFFDIQVIGGAASLNLPTTVNNLEVNAGATLEIHSILNITGDIFVEEEADLIFISTPTSNGELGPVPSSSRILGGVTVQQYMQNKRSYRMVSSPVTTPQSIQANWQEGATSSTENPAPGFGTHITGSTTGENGFDATSTGNPSLFIVNVENQQFESIANTNLTPLTPADAYLLFVRGDRSIDLTDNNASSATTLRAKGILSKGNRSLSFNTTNSGDFVMFGNPYQSTIDINEVFANDGTMNVNTGQYYIYDPSLADYGAYVTVNLPSGTNTAESVANQYLQPGQGAQFATAANGSSQIVFNESNKAPGNFTATSRPLSGFDMITVQLYKTENFNNGGPTHDSFGIIFSDDFDNDITDADAVKPMNFYENLGINHNGTYLSIEKRKMPQSNEVYELYSAGFTNSNYTLKIKIDGLQDTVLYLVDNATGNRIQLESGESSYNFSVNPENPLSIATDRFSIEVAERLTINEDSLLSDIRLYPNPVSGSNFYISAPKLNGKRFSINISDLTGRSIYSQDIDFDKTTISVPLNKTMAAGVYLVTITNGKESKTYRLMKN